MVEHTLNLDYTHSDYLLPLIRQSLATAQLDITDIQAMGIIVGPGSFTGLRIGLAVAKGLALAAQCPLFSFASLESLAARHWGAQAPVIALVPAQRGEVYAGLFDCSGGRPMLKGDYFIGKIAVEVKELLTGFTRFYVVGSEYQLYASELEKLFDLRLIKTSAVHKMPKAAYIIPLVLDELDAGKESCNLESLEPFYMRLSAAEQRRQEKENRDVEQ